MAVSEIKGAPCTRRTHFHGRVHDFRRCAPGVCTFYEPFIIAIYWEGAWSNFRVHSLGEVHPASAQNKSLIWDTGWFYHKDYINNNCNMVLRKVTTFDVVFLLIRISILKKVCFLSTVRPE